MNLKRLENSYRLNDHQNADENDEGFDDVNDVEDGEDNKLYSVTKAKTKPPSLKGFARKYFKKPVNGRTTCSLCNITFRYRLCFLLKHLKEWHNTVPSKIYKNAISRKQMRKDAAKIAEQNPRYLF